MEDCLFCRIIDKKLPAKFAYEDDTLVAIHDVHPQAPVHVLVISKKHIARVSQAEEPDGALLGRMVLAAARIAREQKIEKGYRLVINNGSEAGQSVFHIHLHVLGGRQFHWPPG